MFSFYSVRTRLLSLVGGLSLLAACSSEKSAPEDALLHNDFEGLAGWTGSTPTPTLTKEKAHSGHYALKVDGTNEYSIGFAGTLGGLHNVRVKRIKVSGWVFVPNAQASALFVTHAGDEPPSTKPLVWNGFDLAKAVAGKYNQWVEVSQTIDIPEEATATTNIGFFLWRNAGNQAVYLDDLTVTAEPGA